MNMEYKDRFHKHEMEYFTAIAAVAKPSNLDVFWCLE